MCRKPTAALGLDKVTVAHRQRAVGARRVVRRHVRRAGQPDGAAAGALRHRSAEAEVPAAAADGRTVGAYASSETGSGSDALGAKAGRRSRPDGSFVLNGEKMWITNGGFADVFIVFAKVDGEHFTAFIVERAFGGVTSGKEEHKMGLHGSSTTPVILQDVNVPAENLLGEVGKGHKVAFNVLNFGRFKLGAMCSGGARARSARRRSTPAARKQFGQPIASFGAIKHKLGEMIVARPTPSRACSTGRPA